MKRKRNFQARSSSGVCDAPHVRPGRPAQSPFRNPTTPHPTPTTETHAPPQQTSKQAKPSRTTHTRSTKQLRKAVDTCPSSPKRSRSPPLPKSYCTLCLFRSFHIIERHLCQTCPFNQMRVPTTDIQQVDSIHTVLYWRWRNKKE